MRRVSIALLSGLLAMSASAALAVDFPNGLYWGVNAGVAEDTNFCGRFPPAFQFSEIPGCDDKDFGWQLYAGYQLMKWLSAEGGYTDLGSSDLRVVQDSNVSKVKGWNLGIAFTLPYLEKIGLYGVGGAYFWDKDVVLRRTGLTVSDAVSDTGTDYYYGIALRYPFTEKIGISLEFKEFRDVGSKKSGQVIEVGNSDHRLYTGGLTFRF